VSETRFVPRSAFDGLRTGRRGAAFPEPGITVVECGNRLLASVAARRDKADSAAACLAQRFGLDPPRAPRYATSGGICLAWSGPDQWMAHAEASVVPDLADRLQVALAGLASVTDQTDGWASLRLSGARTREVLAKGLALDVHPRVFRSGDVALGQIEGMPIRLLQVHEAPVYEIMAYRSMARCFFEWLQDSASEFGLELLGG